MKFSAKPLSSHAIPTARELSGFSRLVVDGVLGVTSTVEHLHQSILSGAGPMSRGKGERTRGLTGLVYKSVRGTTLASGWCLQRLFKSSRPGGVSRSVSSGKEAWISALNGVWGDHLLATRNPLGIQMSLRQNGRPVPIRREALIQAINTPSKRILIMVHGLCMNDLQWKRNGHDHGQQLAASGDMTALYLHYNSGLSIPANGLALAQLLETLITEWAVPVESIHIVGHSMGGLVTRSACHYGSEKSMSWIGKLGSLCFLGTPHHGAPLEQGGRYLDRFLDASPYLSPFGKLGRARSAGIRDLRFGNIISGGKRHKPAPLPSSVTTYLVAAVSSSDENGVKSRLIGDGLVPLKSALGEHKNPAYDLNIPESRKLIIRSSNHWDLLNHPTVCEWLLMAIRASAEPGNLINFDRGVERFEQSPS